jgi:DNA-binding MarR family transcriptional regulator
MGAMMARVSDIGEEYRGEQGRIGYLLVQAHHAFASAMENELRHSGLTRAQFGTLSVVARQPGLSAAELARAVMVTPQAINLLVGGLEREGLIDRRPHPTHGRILEIHPTKKGIRRLQDAYPAVTELEDRITGDRSERQIALIKRWLVDVARTLTETEAKE